MADTELVTHLRDNWGWIALRGVAAIVFAALAFAWPGLTLVVLTLFWGAYALVDGIFALIAAFRMRDQGRPIWGWVSLGVLGVLAGLAAIAVPGLTALALLMFIAFWAIVIGVLQIVVAIRIRKEIRGEWLLVLSGAISVLFGVVMVANPGAGALAFVWIIAMYAAFFGVLLVALALRLRSHPAASRSAATP